MSHKETNGFSYTYSAREQAELKQIREKYLPETAMPELDKMEQIRRLDAGVTRRATRISLIVGIISTLIMGCGMSLIMTDLKYIFGLTDESALWIGILIGSLGMAGVILAYPLYQWVTVRDRKKIASEILRLTDELMNEE